MENQRGNQNKPQKTIKSKNNICFTAGGLDAVKNFLL